MIEPSRLHHLKGIAQLDAAPAYIVGELVSEVERLREVIAAAFDELIIARNTKDPELLQDCIDNLGVSITNQDT